MSVVADALAGFSFRGKKLTVSCSGGVDSMVLLHALVRAGYQPEVLHVNYHLRGADSDLDQQLVEQAASALGLNCSVYHCAPEITRGKGINLQAAAREFRRKLYLERINASPQSRVVLAHHADDQVETFFLQYFRGSGSLGLGGMYPEKNGILRPLLDVSRQDILDYAVANNVSWREDNSNHSVAYVRNLLRNKLIPALLGENDRLSESVLLLMRAFREQRALSEVLVAPLVEKWETERSISADMWTQLESDSRILFLHQARLPVWLKNRMEEIAGGDGSQKLEIPGGLLVLEDRKIKLIGNEEQHTWDFKIEEVEILPSSFSRDEIYLDGAAFSVDEIVVRRPQNGDRIKSVGMKGSQLLSDVLRDAGIPLWKRPSVKVVEVRGVIIWLPGIKVGRTFLAHDKSARIIRLSLAKVDC